MAQPVLTAEPSSFQAGDSLSWTRCLSDYPTDDGWSLLYCFRGNGLTAFDVASTTSGNLQLTTITAAQSAGLIPGRYDVSGYAVKTSTIERVQFYSGQILVTQNFQTMEAGVDTRSQARRIWENIRAVIEGRASSSILNSTVNGTTLGRMSPEQLQSADIYWWRIVLKEENDARTAQGKPSSRGIFIRFNEIS